MNTENAQKHTPGPWTLSTPPVCACRCRYVESETEILAEVRDTSNGVFVDVANARLIAAAPELLGSLKDVLKELQRAALNGVTPRKSVLRKIMPIAYAAIDKAERSAS